MTSRKTSDRRNATSKRTASQPVTAMKGNSEWFVHDRFGMFIHWGLYSMAARHEWIKNREQIPDEAYNVYFRHFNPDLYDPREWARLAREAGMKYMVITTKHHEGFCLWHSKHTAYNASHTPYGKDLLKPMVKAFRDEGLRVGFYYSLIDWHHPHFTVDDLHPMRNNPEERKKNSQRDIRKYARYMRKQVEELLTGFGPVDLLWFDFSYPGPDGKGQLEWESEKLLKLVRKLQPDVLIDNRLDLPGTGDFLTPEQWQPPNGMTDDQGQPAVWEACQTFSGSWGYHRDEHTWKSVPQLLWMLIDGVSKGGNLLLNVGPTGRGEFDARARDRLAGIGEWMKRHSRSIYGCGAAPDHFSPPPDCRYTYNPTTKRLYLHLMAWPFGTVYCPGLEGRFEYAQFLHDGSEVRFRPPDEAAWAGLGSSNFKDMMAFNLPVVKPPVEIPVIEIFLN